MFALLIAEAAAGLSLDTVVSGSVSVTAMGVLIWLVKQWQSVTLPSLVAESRQAMTEQRTDFLEDSKEMRAQFTEALKQQAEDCKIEQANIHAYWKLVMDRYHSPAKT